MLLRSHRRGLVTCFATLAFALPTATRVEATAFTLQSYTVTLHTSGPGLLVWQRDLLADDEFEIDAGELHRTALFQIGTNEPAINADDWIPRSIAVDFNFTTPLSGFAGTAHGVTSAVGMGRFGLGYVLWDSPLQVAFGTTGLLDISLSPGLFGARGRSNIDATFSLVRDDVPPSTPTASVPEPSALMLMGSGMAWLVYRRRV